MLCLLREESCSNSCCANRSVWSLLLVLFVHGASASASYCVRTAMLNRFHSHRCLHNRMAYRQHHPLQCLRRGLQQLLLPAVMFVGAMAAAAAPPWLQEHQLKEHLRRLGFRHHHHGSCVELILPRW